MSFLEDDAIPLYDIFDDSFKSWDIRVAAEGIGTQLMLKHLPTNQWVITHLYDPEKYTRQEYWRQQKKDYWNLKQKLIDTK